MTLTPGTRLGVYEVTAQIGAGGMGEVYRARDTRLDRIVAIKVLPASLAGDPQLHERFDREARAISALPFCRRLNSRDSSAAVESTAARASA
jgi:serine/threonine protein kinase